MGLQSLPCNQYPKAIPPLPQCEGHALPSLGYREPPPVVGVFVAQAYFHACIWNTFYGS
jgi:hypothetical protein